MNPVYVEVELQQNNYEYALDINENTQMISLDMGEIVQGGGQLPWYEGAYTVAPRKVEQVLPTEEKSMIGDVTIEAIHYSEVSNPSGGTTINIGFE